MLKTSERNRLLIHLLHVLVKPLRVVGHGEELWDFGATPDRQNFLPDCLVSLTIISCSLVLKLASNALQCGLKSASLETVGSDSD